MYILSVYIFFLLDLITSIKPADSRDPKNIESINSRFLLIEFGYRIANCFVHQPKNALLPVVEAYARSIIGNFVMQFPRNN
jgi:hypothetical protein